MAAEAMTKTTGQVPPFAPKVKLKLIERIADLNDNAERLFATPEEGLNR